MTEPTKNDLEKAKVIIATMQRAITQEPWERLIARNLAQVRQEGYEKGCQYSREMWHCIRHDECGWAEDPKEAYCRKCVIEGAKMMQEAAAERAYDWGVDYAIPSDIAQAIRALDAEKIIEKGG